MLSTHYTWYKAKKNYQQLLFSAYYTWYKEKIYQLLFFEIDVGSFLFFCQLAKLIDIGTFYVHELFWMLQCNRDDTLLFEP